MSAWSRVGHEQMDVTSSLIVDSEPPTRVWTAPVFVDSSNLTEEIAAEEDARIARSASVDPEHVREIFSALFAAAPRDAVTDRDRAKVVLCRLLLGPVAIPCYCEEWDVDSDYMAPQVYLCTTSLLFVHQQSCRCGTLFGDHCKRSRVPRYNVIRSQYSTYVLRGLLSLWEWNNQIPPYFCVCAPFQYDMYVMTVLPNRLSLSMIYYPYFMGHLARFLTVPEMDACCQELIDFLDDKSRSRISVHYKMLFGLNIRPLVSLECVMANYEIFGLELQKLRLRIGYHHEITHDFFEVTLKKFHRDPGWAMKILRFSANQSLYLHVLPVAQFKQQILFLEVNVRYGKSKKDTERGMLIYRQLAIIFAETDVIWRNLFYLYYVKNDELDLNQRLSRKRPGNSILENRLKISKRSTFSEKELLVNSPAHFSDTSRDDVSEKGSDRETGMSVSIDDVPTTGVVSTSSEMSDIRSDQTISGKPDPNIKRHMQQLEKLSSVRSRQYTLLEVKRYVRQLERLSLVRFRQCTLLEETARDRVGLQSRSIRRTLDFRGESVRERYRKWLREKEARSLGHEPTVRVILGGREFSETTSVSHNRMVVNAFNTNRVINVKATLSPSIWSSLVTIPRNMTHSFVMYKHTFKEPACTISTFVSNDTIRTNSLNVNIRGSYLDFLYALSVYRLYVNVDHYFLPAVVCNSNSSLDLHGLEDQSVIRSERKRVYWTTNFPCMISTSNNINVGWFKAATAIIPKVSGRALENVMLKELGYVCNLDDMSLDYGLHRILTELELRNAYQIPFLSKQFIIFLRVMLLRKDPIADKLCVDRLLFRMIRHGVFDYSKEMVSHTKIKHTCALVGTRLANNIPKVLFKNKKLKLDYLGRNASVLTTCSHVDSTRVGSSRYQALAEALEVLREIATSAKARTAIQKLSHQFQARTPRCVSSGVQDG